MMMIELELFKYSQVNEYLVYEYNDNCVWSYDNKVHFN